MGRKTLPKRHRKTKAALAAGAVASTVAATAAFRRRNRSNPAEHAAPEAGPGDTQPL